MRQFGTVFVQSKIQNPKSKIEWRELLVHGLIVLVLLAFLFPGTFLRGEMVSPGYLLLQMLPWKAYAEIDWPHSESLLTWEFLGQSTGWSAVTKTALAQGEWPLWNPLELTGLPLLANCQSVVLYPLRLLHDLFDFHTANTLFVLLKMALCGLTSYLCARGIGFGIGVSRFFSVAWMLCTFHLTWCYWPLPDEGVWFPLMFLGAEWLLEGRYRKGFFLGLFGATMMILAGHPETAFALGLGSGIYFLVRLLLERRWRKPLWLPVLLAGSAWAAAIAACAGLLLPFAEYAMNSGRSAIESGAHALSPGVLVCFLVPRFFGMISEGNFWGNWNSNFTAILYPGLATWIGISLLSARFRRKDLPQPDDSRLLQAGFGVRAACFAAAAVFSILMVFDHPVLRPLKQIPPFGSMWEVYYTPAAVFNLIGLAALGLEEWFSRPRRLREIGWTLLIAGLCAVPVLGFYEFVRPTFLGELDAYVRRQLYTAGAFAGICLLAVALSCIWRRPRVWIAALTLLLACDLLVAGWGLRPTTPRNRLWLRTQLTDYLRSIDPPPRVAIRSATISSGLMQYYGIEEWQGYDGLYPYRSKSFMDTLQSDVWKSMEPACSINYYLHLPALHPFFPRDEGRPDGRPGGFELVAALDGLEVYKNTLAFPRAFLVGAAMVVPDRDRMFQIMRDTGFDPGRVALLEAPPPGPISLVETPGQGASTASPGSGVGAATFVSRTMNTVNVEADAKKDCVLVLADCFFPGWEATVDGKPAEIFPVYSVFRGLLLPPGHHTIRYQYRPWSFRVGLAVSVFTLSVASLAAFYVLASIARAKRAQQGSGTT